MRNAFKPFARVVTIALLESSMKDPGLFANQTREALAPQCVATGFWTIVA